MKKLLLAAIAIFLFAHLASESAFAQRIRVTRGPFGGVRQTVVSNGFNTTIVQNRGLFGRRQVVTNINNAAFVPSVAVVSPRVKVFPNAFVSRGFVNSGLPAVAVNPFAVQATAVPSQAFFARQFVQFVPNTVAVSPTFVAQPFAVNSCGFNSFGCGGFSSFAVSPRFGCR